MKAGILIVDLHGKSQYQAKIALDAQLRRAKSGVYRIRAVHGYHQGTALRDMIRREYTSHTRVLRLDCSESGATDLILREF